MTTPHVGQLIMVKNYFSNGLNVHPGMITRVWKYDEEKAHGMVNITIFPDAMVPTYLTSIDFFPDEQEADFHLKHQGSYGYTKIVCYAKD